MALLVLATLSWMGVVRKNPEFDVLDIVAGVPSLHCRLRTLLEKAAEVVANFAGGSMSHKRTYLVSLDTLYTYVA